MIQFGQKNPVRDEKGEIIGHRPAVVSRVTRNGLNGMHGPDRDKPLIVSLMDGDIVSVRVKGTRREPLTVTAHDLYTTLLRWSVNKVQLEKARERKVRKKVAREAASLRRADRRMSDHAKAVKAGGAL